MNEQLSPFQIKRGRRIFDSYSATNSFSFALVTGNTITLYALALGASSTVVGLLSAFMFLSFFAVPLGKVIIRRSSLVKTFANNWMFRNASLVPLLALPYLVTTGKEGAAIWLLTICIFCFNFFRGIGLIANNPVIGSLAPGKDRGEYIVRISLVNNATALVATLFLAFLLYHHSGVQTYNLVMLIGILTGVAASALLYKLPEPPLSRSIDNLPGDEQSHFFSHFLKAFKESNFRRFLLSYLLLGLGIGMARPFIIVYCKAVYDQPDSMVTIFSVCATIGALLMGAVMRLVIDRLGAKPLYIIFASISLFSLLPALISPGLGSAAFAVGFLCLFAAATNMGFAGQENAAQTYFFSIVPKESVMDLSMLYYFVLGGTGAVGSILGGSLLDALAGAGLPPLWSFRLFFLATVVVIGVGILVQRKLMDYGSYPVLNTLAILLSPRDMRALTLLRRLDAHENPDQETEIIAELGEVASAVSADNLVAHLASPRYAIRLEALKSMESLRSIKGKNREALLTQLREHSFTTAATAARLLGKFNVQSAVPDLRAALDSPDYLLCGQTMVALARLNDRRGQFLISERLLVTENEYILLRGVQAMEEFGNAASLPILLDLLRRPALPLHVQQEIVLALATLMGLQKRFYYALEAYTLKLKTGEQLLLETLEENFARGRSGDALFRDLLLDYYRDPARDSALVHWIQECGRGKTGVHTAMLVSVMLDSELNRMELFRFFLSFWAASVYAKRSLIEK